MYGRGGNSGLPKLLPPKLPPSKLPPPAAPGKATMRPPTARAAPAAAEPPKQAPSKRQEAAKARETEELRQYGLAPLAVDAVSGEEISPHIPRSIAAVPWYDQNHGSTTLAHQRSEAGAKEKAMRDEHGATRVGGMAVVGQANRFRAGACTNCGSMTHKTRECTERKRAVGAKHARDPAAIAPDVVVDDGNWASKTWEQKRDATAGLDVAASVEEEFARARAIAAARGETLRTETDDLAEPIGRTSEDARKALRSEGGDALAAEASDNTFRRVADLSVPKYLVNLNSGTAHYDPSTRTLRGNPLQSRAGDEDKYVVKSAGFAGDNARNLDEGYRRVVQQQAFLQRVARDGEAGTSFSANSAFLPTENEQQFNRAMEARRGAADGRRALLDAVYGPSAPPA
eukprot:CAMPEP_0174842110 /NCGR_PEP_ID=MMETSP1114-20130205/9708_1 /TAXON_ID=312471 /ORGANISM="Neobodo designis, Strain CCAP 1951/1" /LENGTH=399 /DNA_ID=CAMNT_0016076307 /DNA_START=77 /DNA_END=1272 /DNA_ORIENTATION=+